MGCFAQLWSQQRTGAIAPIESAILVSNLLSMDAKARSFSYPNCEEVILSNLAITTSEIQPLTLISGQFLIGKFPGISKRFSRQ
jgi:hypothetical protein